MQKRDKKTGRFTNISLEIRFWDKVKKVENGCWEWQNEKVGGYGRIRIDGVKQLAHRVSWIMHFGGIPKNMHVLHTCDNPSCVNPEHLFIGTHQDNMKDRDKKGRGVLPYMKLSPIKSPPTTKQ